MVIGNIIDTIEFEQIVETGDETIIAMDLQQKILRALQLTDWKVELDFAALSEALFTATGVIIAIAAIAVIAPEVAGAIVAIMTIGQGIDAAINMIKGIMQLSEALNLIDKARSKRALKVGGEKLKEGILNIGVGIIEALLAKCTMKNLANARTQVLKNVTPQPAVLPPAAGNPAPRLPALPIGREELTLILNKSAANAVENATRMSVPQSEKAALREMSREQPLPDYERLSEINVEKTDYKEIKLSRNDPIVQKIAKETSSEILNELATKNSIKTKITAKIKEVGWTEKVFAEKAVTPISKLSDEDLLKIKKINEVIPNPTNDTLMSKVISEETYKMYISNGEYSDTIGNCIAKAEDLSDCKTYMDYYNKLGLNYFQDGKPGPYTTAEKMYVVRFISGDTETKVVRNIGGTTNLEVNRIKDLYKGQPDISVFRQDDPFVGTGFTKTPSGELGKPEYNTKGYCTIEDGAAIYELARNSQEKIVAIRIENSWISIQGE